MYLTITDTLRLNIKTNERKLQKQSEVDELPRIEIENLFFLFERLTNVHRL